MKLLLPRWDSARAALWMGGFLISFTLMAVAGRELAYEFNIFQILFWRSASGAIIVIIILYFQGKDQLKTKFLWRHLARNVFHFAAQYGWFYAIAVAPLARVFAIEFTTAIWLALIAAIFLNERITRKRWISIGLGFGGILIITRPGLDGSSYGDLAVLGAAVGYAAVYAITKSVANKDSAIAILFYMVMIQTPISFALSVGDWSWPNSEIQWLWITLVGASALSGHYCMTRAFRLADASSVVPIDFLRLPLIAIIGYLIYSEMIELWVLVGAVIIIIGNYINIRETTKK